MPRRSVLLATIYVASSNNRLAIVDVSDPISPVELGSYDLPGPVQDVAVRGHVAYVADTAALRLLDISDPANQPRSAFTPLRTIWPLSTICPEPVRVARPRPWPSKGTTPTSTAATATRLSDTSNPAHPTRAGSLANISGSMTLAMNGYGYVLGPDGLRVLTSRSRRRLRRLAHTGFRPSGAETRLWGGQHVYVLVPDYGMQIIDLSDPTRPVLKGDYQLSSLGAKPGLAVQRSLSLSYWP